MEVDFKCIKAAHVVKACEKCAVDGWPPERSGRNTFVEHNGVRSPAKYVLGVAYQIASGKTLKPDDYSGGEATAKVLEALGFKVYKKTPGFSGTGQPLIGRLVATKASQINLGVGEARKLLSGELAQWPTGREVEYLIAPGGFILLTRDEPWDGEHGWASRPRDFKIFAAMAKDAVAQAMTSRLAAKIGAVCHFLTLGVDVRGRLYEGQGMDVICETVVTWDAAKRKVVAVTGKSLPASGQERFLVGEPALGTHLQKLGGKKVLVLGCHDLIFFSERAKANQVKGSPKFNRRQVMVRLAKKFKPELILQHPHSTDTPGTWRSAWAGASRVLGKVPYASGIAYYRRGGPRQSLKQVLAGTRSSHGDVFDFVLGRKRSR